MHPHVFVFKQVQSESFGHQLIIMTIINILEYYSNQNNETHGIMGIALWT